jgi:hypothetical protein
MLFTLISSSVCFQQDVPAWTSNAPLLIARRSILTIAECSQNLHAGYTHNKHTTSTIVCPAPRKHTRFKLAYPLSFTCIVMQPPSTSTNKDPLLYEKLGARDPSVSTAASTASLTLPSTSSISSTSLLTSNTSINEDDALLLAKQGEPLVPLTRKFPPPSQRYLRTGVLAPTKTQLEAERKADKISTAKAKEDKKAASKLRKDQLKAAREIKRVHLAEDRAKKATSRAMAAQRALEEAVAKQKATATDPTPPTELAQSRKKSKSNSGSLTVGSAAAIQQYQSPQRKSTSENKRVSIRSPKTFLSDALSVSSGSGSETSSAGVQTIGDDTSDSASSVASVPEQELVHASKRGRISEPRGGRKHSTPQRRTSKTISDRYSLSQLRSSSSSSSDSSGSSKGKNSTPWGAGKTPGSRGSGPEIPSPFFLFWREPHFFRHLKSPQNSTDQKQIATSFLTTMN